MFLIYNVIGLGMAVIGAVVALVTARVTPDEVHGPGVLALGITWIAIDLIYRIRKGSKRVFHWRHGGQLFFVPIWCWGALCIYLGVVTFREAAAERRENDRQVQHLRELRAASTRSTSLEP